MSLYQSLHAGRPLKAKDSSLCFKVEATVLLCEVSEKVISCQLN